MALHLSSLVSMTFLFCLCSCTDQGESPKARYNLASDAELFEYVTRVDPFSGYTLFPGVDSVTSGTLNGSNAHQPLVRVSMNAQALEALQSGALPSGATFPDGSVIFKQIISGGQPTLYAVIYKDKDNPLAGNGWLWAEFQPNGSTFISLTRKGVNCTGCHAREQGPPHDFVRTFERQR